MHVSGGRKGLVRLVACVAFSGLALGFGGCTRDSGPQWRLGGPATAATSGRDGEIPVARTSSGPVVVVKSGDTLASLSARHEVSIADLMAVNGLRDPHIVRGQILMLPAQR
jgi:hypothetical protein